MHRAQQNIYKFKLMKLIKYHLKSDVLGKELPALPAKFCTWKGNKEVQNC